MAVTSLLIDLSVSASQACCVAIYATSATKVNNAVSILGLWMVFGLSASTTMGFFCVVRKMSLVILSVQKSLNHIAVRRIVLCSCLVHGVSPYDKPWAGTSWTVRVVPGTSRPESARNDKVSTILLYSRLSLTRLNGRLYLAKTVAAVLVECTSDRHRSSNHIRFRRRRNLSLFLSLYAKYLTLLTLA